MKTRTSPVRIRELCGQFRGEIDEIVHGTDEGEEGLSVVSEVRGFDEAVRGSEAAASSKSFRCL